MTEKDAFYAAIGARIRARRRHLGLTQVELSARCGRGGNSWIAAIEAGKTQLPAWQLNEVAEALHVTASMLLGDAPGWASALAGDMGRGGHVHPAVAGLRAGLLLPDEAVLTIWPGMITNPEDLPLPQAVCIARKEPSLVDGGKAWVQPDGPADDPGTRYRYLPRARNWRQAVQLEALGDASEVLLLLKP